MPKEDIVKSTTFNITSSNFKYCEENMLLHFPFFNNNNFVVIKNKIN